MSPAVGAPFAPSQILSFEAVGRAKSWSCRRRIGTIARVLAFALIEAVTLPIWVVWILLPRSRLARHLARADWPWLLLGAIYGVCLVRAIVCLSGRRSGSRRS